MFKYLRAVPLILVAGAVVYFSIIICLDNGDWTYIFARVFDMDSEHANNLAYIAIAIQSLFFTSLFSFYLLLTILEKLGVINSAKDYAVVVIFIIALDRVTKIWPEEKRRMVEFS